jgi:transcriptional regulator with GAF, ATPase, and Fis domain
VLESELFGHEKGAFTGAVSRREGRFEQANGGTLFLDEISEVPPAVQIKLLRFLQEREFERVGGNQTIKVDVRVVAATNRDLVERVKDGRFRDDLFYRLNVFPIAVPRLAERRTDVPMLAEFFLRELRYAKPELPPEAVAALSAYDWPGNVRELRNVLERAVILSAGPVLLLEEVTDDTRIAATPATGAGSVRPLVEVEREHILRVMESCDWRVRGPGSAAKLLGINASTLYSRMRKLGIRRSTATPDRRTRA